MTLQQLFLILRARLWLDAGLDGRGVGFVLDLGGVQPGG